MSRYILGIFFFTFGAIIGSYLNMLIHRLPHQLDTVLKRSFCPACEKKLRWYHNIPLLSYIFLRGKCAYCGKRIPHRYFIIELVTALASVYFMPQVLNAKGLLEYAFYFSTFSVLLGHFAIDLKHKILPNRFNLFLAVAFFSYSFIHKPLIFWLAGGLIGLLFPLLVTWLFYLLRGQVGLGFGDIKLFAALGLYLGALGIVQNIFVSCFLGSVVGGAFILLRKMDKTNPIPFGPFIILVAMWQIYFPGYFRAFMSLIM